MLVRTMAGLIMMAGVAIAGCGGGAGEGLSPRAACENTEVALCERIYDCYTVAELAANGFPDSEAACVTRLQAAEGCAAQTVENTCKGNAHYQPDQASICIDQVENLECSQVRDDNLTLISVAPACGKLCEI